MTYKTARIDVNGMWVEVFDYASTNLIFVGKGQETPRERLMKIARELVAQGAAVNPTFLEDLEIVIQDKTDRQLLYCIEALQEEANKGIQKAA